MANSILGNFSVSTYSRIMILLLVVAWEVQCPSQNANCLEDEECRARFGHPYQCIEQGHCMRKDFTYTTKDIIGALVVMLVSMVTNAGGVGAGNLIIPSYMFFFDFVSSDAIPLSRVTIFMGVLVNWIFTYSQRDPKDPNKFLINYNLASVMIPMALCGTQIGVILSYYFPDVFITAVLSGFLVYACCQVYERAQSETAKESESAMKLTSKQNLGKSVTLIHDQQLDQGRALEDLGQGKENPAAQTLVRKDSRHCAEDNSATKVVERDPLLSTRKSVWKMTQEQTSNFIIIVVSWIWISFCALLQGGRGRPSILGLHNCSLSSYVVLGLSQLGGLLIAYVAFKWNQSVFDEEDASLPNHDEIKKHQKLREQLLWSSMVTGVLSGLFGIGGTMMLTVYLLGLGLHPQEANAVPMFMIIFSSSSATALFAIAGAIQLRHAWILMCLSCIGAIIGNLILKKILKDMRKPSLIVWILFGAVCIATIVLPVETIIRAFKNKQDVFSFGTFC